MPLVDIEGYGVEVDFPDSMSDADIAAAIQRDVIPRLQQSQPDSSPRGVLESMSTPERAQVMMHARNGATDLNDALYRMAAERGLDLPNAAPQEKLEALRALEFAPAVPQSTGVAPGKALPAGMDAERLTASPYGIPATPERSGLVPASDSEKYFQSPGGQAEAMRYLARISDPAHQAADIVLEALGVSQGETAGMDPEMKGQLIDVIGGGQNRGFPRQDTAMSSGGIGRDAALFLRSLAAQAAEGVGAGRISPDTPGLGALSRFATDTPRDESNFAVGLAGQVSPLFDPTAKLAMGGVAKAIAPLIRRLPAAAQIPILGAAQLGAFGLHQEGARQIDAGDFGAVELGKATAHSAALGAIVSPAHFIAEPGARLLAESMLFGSGGAILEGRKPETGDYLSALAFMGAMGIAHGAPLEAVRKRMRGQRPTSEEAEALEKVLPEVREAAAPWFGRSGGKIDIPAVEEMLSRPADLGRERPLRTVQQITAESRERERRDRSADEGRRMMARRREEALAQDEAARAKITPETAPEMTDADLVRWMAKEPQGSEVRAILAKELDRRTPPPGEPPPVDLGDVERSRKKRSRMRPEGATRVVDAADLRSGDRVRVREGWGRVVKVTGDGAKVVLDAGDQMTLYKGQEARVVGGDRKRSVRPGRRVKERLPVPDERAREPYPEVTDLTPTRPDAAVSRETPGGVEPQSATRATERPQEAPKAQEAAKDATGPEIAPEKAAGAAKQPWEMTREERETEIVRLREENADALGVPLASEGGISPVQIGRMGRREHAAWQEKAQRRMSVEAQIRDLMDPDPARRSAERRSKSAASGRLAALDRRIEDLSRVGVGKRGKVTPKYQREIDKAEAERAEVLRGYPDLAPPKPTGREGFLAGVEVAKVARRQGERGEESYTTVSHPGGGSLEVRAEGEAPAKDAPVWGVWDSAKKAWLATKQTFAKAVAFAKSTLADRSGFLTIRPGEEPKKQAAPEETPASDPIAEWQRKVARARRRGDAATREPVPPRVRAEVAEGDGQFAPERKWGKDWWAEALQNANIRIDRLEVWAKDKTSARPGKAAEVYVGRAGSRIERAWDVIEDILEPAFKAGLTKDQIADYLHAKHVVEREGSLGEGAAGMSREEAQRILANAPKGMEKPAAKLREFIDETLDIMLGGELITAEQHAQWRKRWPNYVPLQRDFGAGEPVSGSGRGRGFSASAGVKRAKGSKREVLPILSQIVSARARAVDMAEKGRVGRELLKLVEDAGLEKQGWRVEDAEGFFVDEGGQLLLREAKKDMKNKDNVLSVPVEGRTVKIVIPPEQQGLIRALKGLGVEKTIPGLREFTNFQRYMATTGNLEFLFTNFTRDLQEANIHLGEKGVKSQVWVTKNVPAAMKGIADHLRGVDSEWSRYRAELLAEGGGVSWIDKGGDIKRLDKRIQKLADRIDNAKTYGGRLRAAGEAVGKGVEAMNEVVEGGVRLAVYRYLRDNGVAKRDAAIFSKNLTVNFNKKGRWGGQIGSAYMFFNVGVQGPTRMVQYAKRNPARFASMASAMVAAGFVEAAHNHGANQGAYDKMDGWERDNYWTYLMRDEKGSRFHLRVPYGYNTFKVLGTIAYEMQAGLLTPGEALNRFFSSAIDGFSPIQGRTIAEFLSPNILDPFIQHGRNEQWYGGPLMPDQPAYAPKVPDSALYFKSVRPASKSLTEWMNRKTGGASDENGVPVLSGWWDTSPETMDFIFDFLGGGVTKLAGRSTATLQNLITGNEPDPNQIPFSRQLYGVSRTGIERNRAYRMVKESGRRIYSDAETAKFYYYLDRAFEQGDIDFRTKKRLGKEFGLAQAKAMAARAETKDRMPGKGRGR